MSVDEDGNDVDPADADGGTEATGEAAPVTGPAEADDRLKRLAFIVVPAAVVLVAGLDGFLKWESSSGRESQIAAAEPVAVARDTATATGQTALRRT